MKYPFIYMFCILSCLTAKAQTKFVESWIYSEVSLSRGAQTQSVRSLVDTGCSFCVIDSAYATDVFKIRDNDYIIKGKRKKTNYIVLELMLVWSSLINEFHCSCFDGSIVK